MTLKEVEKNHIEKVLNDQNCDMKKAAKVLDIGLATLYRKVKEYNFLTATQKRDQCTGHTNISQFPIQF